MVTVQLAVINRLFWKSSTPVPLSSLPRFLLLLGIVEAVQLPLRPDAPFLKFRLVSKVPGRS
jgi:hypothetical protein